MPNQIYNTYIQFKKFDDKTTNRHIGNVRVGNGIYVESYEMTPFSGNVYYQHIVVVDELDGNESRDHGDLWRIDSDESRPDSILADIDTAIYHGICEYPGSCSRANKLNLEQAQKRMLANLGFFNPKETFHHEDVIVPVNDNGSGEKVSITVSSIRYKGKTVQEVTWKVEKTEGKTTTVHSFSQTNVLEQDIVLLSIGDLGKQYKQRIDALFN